VRRALILAAGMGTRLRPLTLSKPKCLVAVHGTPILESTLNALEVSGYEEVAIVVGYLAHEIIQFVGRDWKGMKIQYYEEEYYQEAGVVNALWYAREWLHSDCLLVEGDVFFRPVLLTKLHEDEHQNCVAVSRYDEDRSATLILTNDKLMSYNVIKEQDKNASIDYTCHYISSNIFWIKKDTWDLLNAHVEKLIESGVKQECYETILNDLIGADLVSLKAVPCDGQWYEIDNEDDLAAAHQLLPKQAKAPP